MAQAVEVERLQEDGRTEKPISYDEVAKTGSCSVDGRYSKYVLLVLFLVYIFNMVDRQILSVLADDIKKDIGLSDGDIGFLYGTAFAVFYAIFGIPLARLADSWKRTRLISIGLGFWSLMTALSGTAKGFASLAVYRFGVGVGEASASPAAYSLLYDYFSPKLRTTALAVYNSGIYVGMGIGLFIGGTVLELWNNVYPDSGLAPFGLKGWQAAFMAVGLPGLLLALWVFTLREPRKGAGDGAGAVEKTENKNPVSILREELLAMVPLVNLWALRQAGAGAKGLWSNVVVGSVLLFIGAILIEVTGEKLQWIALLLGLYCAFSWIQSLLCRDPVCFGLIFKCRTLIYVYVAMGLSVFTGISLIFWSVPYLQRYHGAESADAGSTVGLFIAIAGMIGVLLGGMLADHLLKYTRRAKLYVALLSWSLTIIAGAVMLLSASLTTAYVWLFLLFFFVPFGQAPLASVVNDLVIPRTRAIASALALTSVTFLGVALGPYVVGLLSDSFIASGFASGEALRQALLIGLSSQVIGICLLLLAIKHFVKDEDSRLVRARKLGEVI